VFTLWTQEFNCTFGQLNITVAVSLIFLGVGCVVLQPTAMKLGRRFVYLSCSVVAIAANILGSQAHSVQVLYVVNLLAGFAAAPVDSLVEISTTDVFFQHERAAYLSWFILALYAGSDLGPVASGYIVAAMSWRWCFYILIIVFAVLVVVQLFAMEDTTFARQGAAERDLLEQVISVTLSAPGEKLLAVETASASSLDTAPRTYWQRMRLIETEYCDRRHWLAILYRPFFLVSFPAVLWGACVYGLQMMWLTLLTTTQLEVYLAAPYHFSTLTVGLTNVSAFLGSLCGMAYGGYFVDYLTIRLSQRNHGVLEPEFRLWAMVLPTVLNAAGLVAYGIGAASGTQWFVSVGLGQFMLGFAMSSLGAICLTYVVDSYPVLASEALVLMLFLRNMIGCGFTFAIQPWLDRCGLAVTTWLLFMMSIVINGSFVVLLIWGKDCRRWTRDRYYRFADPSYGDVFSKVANGCK
jgi:MFS family permease